MYHRLTYSWADAKEVEEFPSVFPKSQKSRKKTPTNSSVQASSSAKDTNTVATSGEEDRKRKVPTNNRFTVNDIPLSEYDTETTTTPRFFRR